MEAVQTKQPGKKGRLALAVVFAFGLIILFTSQAFVGEDVGAAAASNNLSPFTTVGPSLPAGPEAAENIESTNCRYGIGYVPESVLSEYWFPTIGAGWFVTFSIWAPEQESSQFIPVLRVRQDHIDGVRQPTYTFLPTLPQMEYFIRNSPKTLWLIGNEIEIDNTRQDNMMPEVYAQAYHEAYTYIKKIDPTAQVGIGSVTMGTPGRLQYLDIVWDTYKELYGVEMPIDVWNVHIYILAERNLFGNGYADGKIALGTDPELAIKSSASDPLKCPSPDLPDIPENDPRPDVYCKAEYDSQRIFREQVRNIRQWMKDHGEQDKPLIISEYGQLSSYTNPGPDCTCEHPVDEFGKCMCPERVSAYLQGTMSFLDNATDPEIGYPEDDYRLVQRWLWYSMVTPFRIGRSSNLLVDDFSEFRLGSEAALTQVGEAYRQMANSPANQSNLVGGEGSSTSLYVENPTDRATERISVSFRNTGTRSVADPFTVSFFADEALTQFIGYTLVNPNETGVVMGCRWTEPDYVVQFEWTDLPVGTHHFWAKIDSSGSVPESSEADNVTSRGTVAVYSVNEFAYNLFLPVTRD